MEAEWGQSGVVAAMKTEDFRQGQSRLLNVLEAPSWRAEALEPGWLLVLVPSQPYKEYL